MIDPEEYRDLVEENTMLRKELKAAKEENTRLRDRITDLIIQRLTTG